METVISVTITQDTDPEVIGLINEFASLQHLKPRTALKQYLLQTLPAKIETIKQNTPNSRGSQ